MAHALWITVTIAVALDTRERSQYPWLIRFGRRTDHVAAEWRRGTCSGLLIATTFTAGVAVMTWGLPWTAGWGGIAQLEQDQTMPLNALATLSMPPAVGLALQLLLIVMSSGLVGALAARAALWQ